MPVDQGADDRPGPAAGLFQSLSNFASTVVAIAHTRLELLTTELQEEVRQVGAILLWAFIAVVCGADGAVPGRARDHLCLLGHAPRSGCRWR